MEAKIIGTNVLSRIDHLKTESKSSLFSLHDKLAHTGVTRFWHYIYSKKLPHTLEDVKQVIATCNTCQQLKPSL